jgi:hypothetical protein
MQSSRVRRLGPVRRTVRAIALVVLAGSTAACAGTLSGLEYVAKESALNSDSNKLAVAHCPAGRKVTGGGASVGPQTPELAVIRSEPTTGGAGWIAQAVEVSAYAFDWRVTATAICTTVAP